MWDNYRALRMLSSRLFVVALAMLLYSGGFYLLHSSLFPLRKIYIAGKLVKVSKEQLSYLANHELHGTFFTLDLDEARTSFAALPWVKEVKLKRRWPDSLEVELSEHKVLARWAEDGLIDTNGDWFGATSDELLPVLYGPANSEKDLADMLVKLRQWLAPSALSPQRIELLGRGAWRVELSNHVWLELGRGDDAQIEHRARVFALYWQAIKARMPNGVSYIDMRYPNGFSVLPLPAAAVKKGHLWSNP